LKRILVYNTATLLARSHAEYHGVRACKPMYLTERDQLTGIMVVEEECADAMHGLLEQVLVGKVNTFIHKQEFHHAGNKYQYRQQ
jgi:hypothetical protein